MTLVVKKDGSLFPDMISDFFKNDFLNFPGKSDFIAVPSANITEGEKEFKIELSAPGYKKDELKVEIDGNTVTISSEKEKDDKEEKKNYYRREFSYSSFSRSFQLPENSLPEKIQANYKDGILELSIPKKEVSINKSKKAITVN